VARRHVGLQVLAGAAAEEVEVGALVGLEDVLQAELAVAAGEKKSSIW
jgi:hypothetical protein